MKTSTPTTETEVKLLVKNLPEIEAKLVEIGAILSALRVYEQNIRYENTENTLTSTGRVVRLRLDSRARLTYKEDAQTVTESSDAGVIPTDGITRRTELEVTVNDFDTMNAILGKLGYSPAWIYEKFRTTYELDDCEIVLDELPIGQFVEIEGDAPKIEAMLSKLGLSDIHRITESYSVLFFKLKTLLGFDFRDLTFENFKNVPVNSSQLLSEASR